MIDAAERRKKVKKQAEPKKLISESSDDEESDEEDTIDTAAIKKAAKEKWNELLQSLIVEHVQKRKKNATGKKKKKNTISVTECSTSEKVKKGKRAAIEIDSDSDSDFERSYSKMAVVTKKKVKKEKIKLDDEGIIKDVKNNERKSINIRMSPRSLKKVLEKLRIPQVEELEKMGFGEFYNNFNFYSIPSELGFWVVRNFDLETRSIKMNDGRKIKITRELVRDMLGIPMGDMKVEALEEKNLFEETTAKWRDVMESVVVKNKIYITKLEEHLISLTEVDWEFRVAFLVLFFSILGQGNKDGEVNERIIPILSNTENVSKMDWCSYVLECLVKECSQYKPNKFFSGPLLLLVLIYVNSTTSETVKVEKTIPAFKAWSSRLLFQRQKEEAELGFGCLPIADGVEVIEPPMKMKKKKLIKKHKSVTGGEEDNLVCQLQTPKIDLKYGLYGTIDMEEANKDFRSKSFEEMKGNIRDNMALCNRLMLDIDYKLLISLRLNPEDEELKKLVETRNDLFAKSYKEDADKNENDGNRGENDQMGDQNKEDRDDENGEENGDDGNYENDQMGEQSINEEGTKDDLNESLNKKTALNEKHDLIDANDILKKVINKRNEDDSLGKDLVGTKDNAIVPFDMDLISTQRGSQSTYEYENQSQEMQYDDLEDIVRLPESQEPKDIFSSKNKRRKLNHEDDVTLSQLSWAIGGEESMNETEMVDKIVKLPFMSTGITDAAKGLAADAPSATATPLYHSTKLKLKRNSSENYDVEKVDISNEAKKTTVDAPKEPAVNVIDAAPVSFFAPINYVPLENIQKEKSVAATKSKADGKKAGNKKEPVKKAKKAASNEEPEKKGRGKKGETKQEMVKAKKAPTKKAEPKTLKDNTQKAKRGEKRGAEAVEEDKEGDIVKEKRTVKPSNAMKSPYYDRKVRIYKKWNEAEMKLVEYMWSDSGPEGDIVFNGKGLQLEGVFFLSLYPEVEVASTIIDLWSVILNKEEQFRDELSGKRNVYCGTLMLPHRMVDFDDGMHLEKRRMKFEENLNSVLETSGLKDLNDVGLIFFPCIKMTKNGSNHYYVICFNLKNGQIDILDNVNNGIENISDRYGKYAQVLIDTFINYLERKKHPKIADIWLASARMVPIKWKTTYNAIDCGIFVMRHMEMYVGEEVFLKELLTEGADLKAQLKMLRAKYLAKILLIDFNLEKKKLLKDAEAYAKKQDKKSKILTHTAVKDDENLLQRFNDTLVKTLE